MPMPTTRRGRFLFYKQRARRRYRRIHSRARRDVGEWWSAHYRTKRPLVTDWLEKQAKRKYPLHFPFKWMTAAEWYAHLGVPPMRGQWGVFGSWDVGGGVQPAWAAANGPVTGYFDRRVMSIPPLHMLDNGPYQATTEGLDIDHVYPFRFYPSGRESYASLQGWDVSE